jgi:hypothetical protein
MTPVHFMGRQIGWFITDRLGACRYLSVSKCRVYRQLPGVGLIVIEPEGGKS